MIPIPGKLFCPRCSNTEASENSFDPLVENAAWNAAQIYRKEIISERDFSDAQTGFKKAALLRGNAPELNWYALLCGKGIRWICTGGDSFAPLLWKKNSGLLKSDSLWQEIAMGCGGSIPAVLQKEADRADFLLNAVRAAQKNTDPPAPDIFFCLKTESEDRLTPEKLFCDRLLDEMKDEIELSRVFYAPKDLAGKKQWDFEPRIFQALQTKGLMIIFASAAKNLMADSVRSEWLRAVSFGTKDICLCTFGNDFYDVYSDILKPKWIINADEVRSFLRKAAGRGG